MAGTHQIWALYLKDSTWLKGGSVLHDCTMYTCCQLLISLSNAFINLLTCTCAKQAL